MPTDIGDTATTLSVRLPYPDSAGHHNSQGRCNELPAVVLYVQASAGFESNLAGMFLGIHARNGDHLTWLDHAGGPARFGKSDSGNDERVLILVDSTL
jgi:hypothetical protein